MTPINSPIFPPQALSEETFLRLPKVPNAQSGSVQLWILVAEKTLFIQGFESEEYKERPPAILRGSLFIRVTKPVKIKNIGLKFCGQARTDWPEGIPPKRQDYVEIQNIIQHNWPFFNFSQTYPTTETSRCGANLYRRRITDDEDISSFSLEPVTSGLPSSVALNTLSSTLSHTFSRDGSKRSLFNRGSSPAMGRTGSATLDEGLHNSGSSDDLNSNKLFVPGDYVYNFEHALPPSTPESLRVTFGNVNYYLEASLERSGTFKSNLLAKEPISIVRTPSEYNMEENEPIAIVKDWEDQLKYDIVIASKSVVLNSFLPVAFRLTPLDKVQCHRIRIYLTEHLEYFCRGKKVHRMEPEKKFLLLEHTPEKGKKSLFESEGEIIARELEFQLYVPEKVNERQKLHPDTSFESIQSHHWIKIGIRLSRADPSDEKKEKRKHYEISIDSPIHVLSPLAAHANTLLPAYTHNHTDLPPQSPDVIPIENSLDMMLSADAPAHLESNLYKPDEMVPELRSPQAQPFSPALSPQMAALSPQLTTYRSPPMLSPSMSQIQRPIHLIRRPSINPPPFEADSSPPPCEDQPPAYESLDGLLEPNDKVNSKKQKSTTVSSFLNGGDSIETLHPSSQHLAAPAASHLKDTMRKNHSASSLVSQQSFDIDSIVDTPLLSKSNSMVPSVLESNVDRVESYDITSLTMTEPGVDRPEPIWHYDNSDFRNLNRGPMHRDEHFNKYVKSHFSERSSRQKDENLEAK